MLCFLNPSPLHILCFSTVSVSCLPHQATKPSWRCSGIRVSACFGNWPCQNLGIPSLSEDWSPSFPAVWAQPGSLLSAMRAAAPQAQEEAFPNGSSSSVCSEKPSQEDFHARVSSGLCWGLGNCSAHGISSFKHLLEAEFAFGCGCK